MGKRQDGADKRNIELTGKVRKLSCDRGRQSSRQERSTQTLVMNPITSTVMQHSGNQSTGYELSFW